MADLIKTISNEWQLISSAWVSFLTIITVVGITVWAFARWSYKERIDTLEHRLLSRDDEIRTLNTKLADAPATPKSTRPANRDEIVQSNRIVGKLHNPDFDSGTNIVLATSLTAIEDYNPERPFTFRDMRLKLMRYQTETETRIEGEIGQEFGLVVCEILDPYRI